MKTALLVSSLLVVSALGVARVQPRLARTAHDVKQRDDIYLLPPPAELKMMSLGYHAAAADILWAKLLVEYGTHWQEKRAWPHASRYFDGILELEPDYPLVYRFADTLMVYRPLIGTEEDCRGARRYLERGTRERPLDHEVWMHYGQFVAFTAPSFLKDRPEIERWRKDGAEAIARAVELGGDADRSVTVATILGKSGEREAAIRQLRRAYVLTDDPSVRTTIANKLQILQASAEKAAMEKDTRFIESNWRKDFAFLPREGYMLMGPFNDAALCAGRDSATDIDRKCPRTWDEALPSHVRATPATDLQ